VVPLGEEIPLEQGHQRGVPNLEIVILPLLAHLARKRLQIDPDMLLIISSTAIQIYLHTHLSNPNFKPVLPINSLICECEVFALLTQNSN